MLVACYLKLIQVHKAVAKNGMKVAMKIQYPGVADSIESDIDNVKLLLDYTNLIPKGLYLDRAIKVVYCTCEHIILMFVEIKLVACKMLDGCKPIVLTKQTDLSLLLFIFP